MMTLATPRLMPLTWAMKMLATASYSAVPSMLMVAPMGATKRTTRSFTWFFCVRHSIVTGRVAELSGQQRHAESVNNSVISKTTTTTPCPTHYQQMLVVIPQCLKGCRCYSVLIVDIVVFAIAVVIVTIVIATFFFLFSID